LSVRLFGFNRTSRSYHRQGKIERRRTNCAKSENEIALLQRGWRLAGAPCSPPPRPPSAREVGTRTVAAAAAAHRRRSARSLLAARVVGARGATAARGSPALPARRSSSSLCLAALLLALGLDEEIATHGDVFDAGKGREVRA